MPIGQLEVLALRLPGRPLKYLLDTNVVFELGKVGDGKADPNVTA